MFQEFYSLKENPFMKTPDPRYLYKGTHHAEAFARLQFAVEERELAVLTGEIGSGKTLLSRALIDSLDDMYSVVLIINPRVSPLQLLRLIAQRLGAENPSRYKSDVVEQINGILCEYHEKGRCPVVILDEAQLIDNRNTFDEIRLLTNFQLDDKNLLSLILIGQPELNERLMLKPYRALRQRIGIHFHLEPLDEAETKKYILFRLKVAGGRNSLFTDDAMSRIYNLSGGIPREINNLCSSALLEGYGRDAKKIDTDVIEDVGRDLGYSLVSASIKHNVVTKTVRKRGNRKKTLSARRIRRTKRKKRR